MRYLILTLLLVALIINGCSCKSSGDSSNTGSPDTNADRAPDFTLPTVDGSSLKLSDYSGNVIILDFLATSCGPCIKEIPGFVKLMNKYEGQPFTIIGVSLDERMSLAQLKRWMNKYGMNYPVVRASVSSNILRQYGGITAIPTTFIIDKKGMIRKKVIGYHPIEFFDDWAKKLLNEDELAGG